MIDQAARLRDMVSGKAGQMPEKGQVRHHSSDTHVIAVSSGKGGVGKTTIAVNLAILLAELGKQVLVLDADLGLANVDVMLGLEPARHIGHLLSCGFEPEDVAAVGPSGIKVISGGSGLKELAEAGPSERCALLEKLRAYYTGFEYVIVDTSPGIKDDVVDFLSDVDFLLLVTTPEPTSLKDSYAFIKTLNRRLPNLDVRLVVNMASSEEAERSVAVLNEVALKFLGRNYDTFYCINNDQIIPRTIQIGRPVISAYPRSSAALCLRRLAGHLLQDCTRSMAATVCC